MVNASLYRESVDFYLRGLAVPKSDDKLKPEALLLVAELGPINFELLERQIYDCPIFAASGERLISPVFCPTGGITHV